MTTVYDFDLQSLDGTRLCMDAYRGQVLLLVNTASRCGFTPQYAGLQKLHDTYRSRGFTVIAFPCNQFGHQEPGTADEIAQFCSAHYGVTFPVSERIDVNGAAAHPLFRHLVQAAPGMFGTQAIKWNFTKFLVSRDGRMIERFGSMTRPEDLTIPIEAMLGNGSDQRPVAGSLSDNQ